MADQAVPPGSRVAGMLAGALAMVFVGGSVAVSSVLFDAPLFTAQACATQPPACCCSPPHT